jgi:hypothetical protein
MMTRRSIKKAKRRAHPGPNDLMPARSPTATDAGPGGAAAGSESSKGHRGALRRFAGWATGLVAAALLTLLATTVFPAALGQFFNSAKIEDALRTGPDIVVNESIFHPDGAGVPNPTVVPGGYQPSSAFARALARSRSLLSPAVEKEIQETHGIDAANIFLRIILQGNRNEAVRIVNIQPAQLHRVPPLNGVLFDIGAQGENSNIQMGFDLDQPTPQALAFHDTTLTNEPYFATHSISLAKGEQAVLIVQAKTSCYSADFKLRVNYLINGQAKSVIIGDHARPFRVTAYRYGPDNVMSYKQIYALRGDFSVRRPTSRQLSRYYRRSAAEARLCTRA